MLPPSLKTAVEAALGTPILGETYVGGGDINQAARLQTATGQFFIKWNHQAPPNMFAAEAQGLQALMATGALAVPDVVALGENFLVLRYIEPTRPQNPTLLAQNLGEGLAALHQHSAAAHGFVADNFIGTLPQSNTWEENWVGFYADQRIGAQQAIAQHLGRLSSKLGHLLDALRAKMPALLPAATPALLHGDLWGGNYMVAVGDVPVIYDPAVYYGHREIELAFTELFGGFSARFYAAYNAVFPLEAGYAERKTLYQLYPLMVHMNLFGGGYTAQVERIAQQYVG